MLDNIWIFVVIIGAVISIAQKNQQKQRKADSNDEPSLDPQAELERRMREIFGESKRVEQTAENRPIPTPKPAQQAGNTQPKPTRTSSQTAASNSTAKGYNISAANKPANKSASQSKPANPIKDGDITAKNEIDEIIEDFTMEKALIYSEIIRPKFDEF